MADDSMADRRRLHEDEYFRKRDQELVEKIRRASADQDARRELGAKTGLSDPAVLAELQTLGFTPDTIALLPLVPVVEMAWAEGGVSPEERALVIEVARSRGVALGSAADQQLARWLDHRPRPEVFAGAMRLTTAVLGADAPGRMTAEDLVAYCEKIAAASGGIFGLGRVSSDERATLAKIVAAINAKN